MIVTSQGDRMARLNVGVMMGRSSRNESNGWRQRIRSRPNGHGERRELVSRFRTGEVAFINERGLYAFVNVFPRRTSDGQAMKVKVPREHFPRGTRLRTGKLVRLDLLSGDPNPIGCNVEILPHDTMVRVS